MKTRFLYSRTYHFESPKGRRRHYFFNLTTRYGDDASFRLNDKANHATIPATIVMDGDVETARFLYAGIEVLLLADNYLPKGYSITTEGREEKEEDSLRDSLLLTGWR